MTTYFQLPGSSELPGRRKEAGVVRNEFPLRCTLLQAAHQNNVTVRQKKNTRTHSSRDAWRCFDLASPNRRPSIRSQDSSCAQPLHKTTC
eukprot:636279-Pelagomonas_calceolata.AAC.1